MNGLAGGKFKLEGKDLDDVEGLVFRAAIDGVSGMPPLVQLRPETMDKLILDADFDFPVSQKDSLGLAQWLVRTVLDEALDFSGQQLGERDLRRARSAVIMTRKDGSPNFHLSFPGFKMDQEQAIHLMCFLQRKFFLQAEKLSGFEAIKTEEAAAKVLDMCVLIKNGVRMVGAPKPGKDGSPGNVNTAYWPSHSIYESKGSLKLKDIKNPNKVKYFSMCVFGHFPPGIIPIAKFREDRKFVYDASRLKEALAMLKSSNDRGTSISPSYLLSKTDVEHIQRALVKELGFPSAPKIKDFQLPRGCSDPRRPPADPTARAVEKIYVNLDPKDKDTRWCPQKGGSHKSVSTFGILWLKPDGPSSLSMRCHCSCTHACRSWSQNVKVDIKGHKEWFVAEQEPQREGKEDLRVSDRKRKPSLAQRQPKPMVEEEENSPGEEDKEEAAERRRKERAERKRKARSSKERGRKRKKVVPKDTGAKLFYKFMFYRRPKGWKMKDFHRLQPKWPPSDEEIDRRKAVGRLRRRPKKSSRLLDDDHNLAQDGTKLEEKLVEEQRRKSGGQAIVQGRASANCHGIQIYEQNEDDAHKEVVFIPSSSASGPKKSAPEPEEDARGGEGEFVIGSQGAGLANVEFDDDEEFDL